MMARANGHDKVGQVGAEEEKEKSCLFELSWSVGMGMGIVGKLQAAVAVQLQDAASVGAFSTFDMSGSPAGHGDIARGAWQPAPQGRSPLEMRSVTKMPSPQRPHTTQSLCLPFPRAAVQVSVSGVSPDPCQAIDC